MTLIIGAARDYQKALEYYRQAAELNDADGLSSLGYMYANGWGVEQDNKTALKYYKEAAHKVFRIYLFVYLTYNCAGQHDRANTIGDNVLPRVGGAAE